MDGKPSVVFQSTRPIRGATVSRVYSCNQLRFQSTRPIRGATSATVCVIIKDKFQSTRPIRGATRLDELIRQLSRIFQSTRPIRGATGRRRRRTGPPRYFNPRAPYGARHGFTLLVMGYTGISIHAPHTGRDQVNWRNSQILHISIHAPHTGRDEIAALKGKLSRLFQSTRPIRGATSMTVWLSTKFVYFNPHAPYGARRPWNWYSRLRRSDFNPHAPYGARRQRPQERHAAGVFQSTRPIRGATLAEDGTVKGLDDISIHTPHTGRDGL